jgi:hypothetical protein
VCARSSSGAGRLETKLTAKAVKTDSNRLARGLGKQRERFAV